MDLSTVTQIITGIGFPAFVAVYLLVKSTQEHRETQEAIAELKGSIDLLTAEIKHHAGEKEE